MNETETLLRFDHEWRVGDRAVAKQIACEYVNENRERLTEQLKFYTREGMVKLVEAYREQGQFENRLVAEMWIQSEFEPIEVTGEIHVKLPRPIALIGAVNADHG